MNAGCRDEVRPFGQRRPWPGRVVLVLALVDALLVLAARRSDEATDNAVRVAAPAAVNAAIAPPGGADAAVTAAPAATPPDASPAPSAASPQPRLSAGVADVAKLVEAGVEEAVVRSYVETSPVAYFLTPEEIIYLRGVGVSSETLTAMIRRGAEVREQSARAYAERAREAASLSAATPLAAPVPLPAVSQRFYPASPAGDAFVSRSVSAAPSVSVIHVPRSPTPVYVPFYARYRPYYDSGLGYGFFDYALTPYPYFGHPINYLGPRYVRFSFGHGSRLAYHRLRGSRCGF